MSTPFPSERNDTACTPDRWTELTLNPPDFNLARPDWTLTRDAGRIGRAAAGGIGSLVQGSLPSGAMLLLPGPAWIMRPVLMDPTQLLTSADDGAINSWTLAANIQMLPYWRAATDLTGVTAGASLQTSADGVLQKRPPTSGTYDTELDADAATLPKPVSGAGTLEMKRIAKSNVSFPANTAFRFQFQIPSAALIGPPSIATFYFGGPSDITPAGKLGGTFAVHVYATGEASLWEYTEAGWAERLKFRWAGGGLVSGSTYAIDIIPYGNTRIAFFGDGAGSVASPHLGGLPIASPFPAAPNLTCYEDNGVATGYATRNPMTGAGPVRIDTRVDLRVRTWVFPLKYPGTDVLLVDEAFPIPGDTPGGSRLAIAAETHNRQNSGVLYSGSGAGIYDAQTMALLGFDSGTQTYVTAPGAFRYYAVWRFQASTDRFNSSVLYSASFSIGGANYQPTPAPLTGGLIQEVHVTGPDVDPTHETAFLEIEDPAAQLGTVLDKRARVHFVLTTRYDPTDPTKKSVLIEGEIQRAAGQRKGKPGYHEGAAGLGALRQWPSDQWRLYRCQCTGMWARVADQILLESLDLHRDPDDSPDFRPYPITKAIDRLLRRAGFPEDQIDAPDEVPGNPLRFDVPASPEDLLLLPSTSIAAALQHLCRDYLGRFLVWDANAQKPGAVIRGMWRLLHNPAVPYTNVLAEFSAEPPVAGRLATHPNSYGFTWVDATRVGPARTFILADSFWEWVVPPEFNYLCVTGTGSLVPSGGGASKLVKYWPNPKSYNSDPNHLTALDFTNPDYLGRRVPTIYVDRLLNTEAAVDNVGDRISGFAGHGQQWAGFRGPLVLVWDTTDPFQVRPRPLRINDLVRVDGRLAIVHSCNPTYTKEEGGDDFQWAEYECVYTTQS